MVSLTVCAQLPAQTGMHKPLEPFTLLSSRLSFSLSLSPPLLACCQGSPSSSQPPPAEVVCDGDGHVQVHHSVPPTLRHVHRLPRRLRGSGRGEAMQAQTQQSTGYRRCPHLLRPHSTQTCLRRGG